MRANGMSRTQRSSKDLVKEISVLKSQLKKLSTAMEADAADGVNGAVSAVQLKSRAAIDDAIEAATSFIEEQTESAKEMADSAIEKASEMRDAAADSLIKTGLASTALVIGAETFSRILEWNDRGTCVLFGDGAGAVVLRAEEGKGTSADRGVLANALHSDGRQHDILYVDGGPSSTGTVGHLRMEGKDVFKFAVGAITGVITDIFNDTGYTADDIDWFVPHQANKRIIDGTGRKLGLKPERVVITVDRHANTSAASIPLALDVAVKDGRIKQGDLLLLEGIGGGLAWGASLIRW